MDLDDIDVSTGHTLENFVDVKHAFGGKVNQVMKIVERCM